MRGGAHRGGRELLCRGHSALAFPAHFVRFRTTLCGLTEDFLPRTPCLFFLRDAAAHSFYCASEFAAPIPLGMQLGRTAHVRAVNRGCADCAAMLVAAGAAKQVRCDCRSHPSWVLVHS